MLRENNVYWPEKVYCEDKLFTAKSVFYANGIVSVPKVNYYYFRNPHSTVNIKDKNHIASFNRDKNKAKQNVLEFFRKQNAKFADKKYWAVSKVNKLGIIPLLKITESVSTERFYLFSFIPVGEKSL